MLVEEGEENRVNGIFFLVRHLFLSLAEFRNHEIKKRLPKNVCSGNTEVVSPTSLGLVHVMCN